MKKFFQNFLLVLSSIILIFVLFEFVLRLIGFTPYKISYKESPKIYKQDKILGWDTKSGNYSFKLDETTNINYKFLTDGSRYSGKELDNSNNFEKIVLVGGSFTMGHKINNEEVMGYFLQENFENYEIKNFGVGGYGTFQTYLKLKRIFKKIDDIKIVIYFFIDNHEIRNVGDVTYLEKTSKSSKKRVYLPYASLDKNKNVIEHAPVKYFLLPFSNVSVLISKIQKKIMRLIIKSEYSDKELITKKLIIKMNDLSKKNNSKFVFVTLLSPNSKVKDYINFSSDNNIIFLDCRIEDYHIYTSRKIDMHPNRLANYKYSKCLKNFIYTYTN